MLKVYACLYSLRKLELADAFHCRDIRLDTTLHASYNVENIQCPTSGFRQTG